MRERGITVVMTTNYLDEADQLCDRIAIIDGGRIKALGVPNELKVGLGGDLVSLTVREHDRVEQCWRRP
jgi:ABC-2 type transport system ATP-binding protein